MAWQPIQDDTSTTTDGRSLPAGIGVDLENNISDLSSTRLKRRASSYYLGPTSSGGATPPNGDSTLVGPTLDIRGSSSSDTEAIGLTLSSPPTTPLAIPLGEWPLSARTTKIRVVVGCATSVADVDLYACAVVNGGIVPAAPMINLEPDASGVVSFGSAVTGTTAHVTVGTTAPSATQTVKPVALTIDLGGAARVDYGYHGAGDGLRICRLYLCILSAVGSLDVSGTAATWEEGGRRITTSTAMSTWSQNPGPFHRWIKFTGAQQTEFDEVPEAFYPQTRGVLQLRPEDRSALASSDASLVIHPPVPEASPIRTDGTFELYTCGKIQIHGISVQELGA